jgi:hypothetical protein
MSPMVAVSLAHPGVLRCPWRCYAEGWCVRSCSPDCSAIQAFLVACRAPYRCKLRPPSRVEGEQAGVEARRIRRGDVMGEEAEPSGLQTVGINSIDILYSFTEAK